MRLKFKFFLIVVLIFTCSLSVSSQESISSSEAVAKALLNNFSILVAKNNSEISDLGATRGNAGMLPRIDIESNANIQGSTINQRFSNGLEVNTSGVTGNAINASANLGWTLFDGGRMFVAYHRLNTQADLSDLELRAASEDLVHQVLVAFYDIERKQQDVQASKVSLELLDQQLLIINKRLEIGAASRQEVLQAKIDKNAALAALMNSENELLNAKTLLNQLMQVDVLEEFVYDFKQEKSYDFKLKEVMEKALNSNVDLKLAEINKVILDYQLKEFESERFPILNLNAAYNYTRSSNSAGFALFNQSNGPSGGLSLSWNLFNGSQLNSKINQQKLFIDNSEFVFKSNKTQLEGKILLSYRKLMQSKQLLKLEEDNIEFAKENYQLAIERLKIGQATILEVKEASRSFEQASLRLSTAKLQNLEAETELLRFSGELIH